jgi:hypothetical protein
MSCSTACASSFLVRLLLCRLLLTVICKLHSVMGESCSICAGLASKCGFQECVCAGENWNQVMYDGMRTTNPASAVYFLFIVLIGNYVMLNLFLAILLDNFAGGDSDEADKKAADRTFSTSGQRLRERCSRSR